MKWILSWVAAIIVVATSLLIFKEKVSYIDNVVIILLFHIILNQKED